MNLTKRSYERHFISEGKLKWKKFFRKLKAWSASGKVDWKRLDSQWQICGILRFSITANSQDQGRGCQNVNFLTSVHLLHQPKNSPVLVCGRTLQGVHSKRWQWWGFVHLAESPTTGGGGHWQLVSLLLLTSPNQLLLLTLDEWISHCISHQGFWKQKFSFFLGKDKVVLPWLVEANTTLSATSAIQLLLSLSLKLATDPPSWPNGQMAKDCKFKLGSNSEDWRSLLWTSSYFFSHHLDFCKQADSFIQLWLANKPRWLLQDALLNEL